MADPARRKALKAGYARTRPTAGVYRIVNRQTGKVLIGYAVNLASAANRFAFSQSTASTGGLDYRLHKDFVEFGPAAFAFEVLESIDPAPETTPAELKRDLETLAALWREQADPALLY